MRKKCSHYQPAEAAEKLAPIISKAEIFYEFNLDGNVDEFDSSLVTGIRNTLNLYGQRAVLEKYSKDLLHKEFDEIFEEDDFNDSEYNDVCYFTEVYLFETKDGGKVVFDFYLEDYSDAGNDIANDSPQASEAYAILNNSSDLDTIVKELKRMRVAHKKAPTKSLTLKKAALELKAIADMLLKA